MRRLAAHVVVVFAAVAHAMRWRRFLGIRIADTPRYVKKAANLSLCYVGFSDGTLTMASRAGKAGFLCAVYDVVTDWPGYSHDEMWQKYYHVLSRQVSPELVKLTTDLYAKDRANNLANDGLERGSVAVEFICSLLGSKAEIQEKMNLVSLGELCQIADDILDMHDDLRASDTNCLLTPRGRAHLTRLITTLSEEEARRLFPHGLVMLWVLRQARKKAKHLLDSTEAVYHAGGGSISHLWSP